MALTYPSTDMDHITVPPIYRIPSLTQWDLSLKRNDDPSVVSHDQDIGQIHCTTVKESE